MVKYINMKKSQLTSNALTIRVCGIGFDKNIEVADGSYQTFVGALAANQIDSVGYLLFVNGVNFIDGDELQDGDTVQVVRNEKNA